MKTDHGLVWSKVHEDKSIGIGFTKQAIEERLMECFHVMQADTQQVREKGPMLVLETNDGLESIKSPFTGRVSYFNSKARNFPDKLTEEDTILTILPPGVEPKKATTKTQKVAIDLNNFTSFVTATMTTGSDLFTTGTSPPVTDRRAVATEHPRQWLEPHLTEGPARPITPGEIS